MATIEFDGTTVFSESSGEITYHGNFNSSTIFPANQVINTQSYRFSAIMDMNGTSAETTWWSVKFNRLLSNSKLFVNSATPMFQLPNGVWIGNAIKVTCGSTVYRACRGQGNARPNTDTTLMSFLSVFSDSEIGTTTGEIQVDHIWHWNYASGTSKPFEIINFMGGGTGNQTGKDTRVREDKFTEGSMQIMEITQ